MRPEREQGDADRHRRGDKARAIFLRPEMAAELDLWLNTRALFRSTGGAFVNLRGGDGRNSGERPATLDPGARGRVFGEGRIEAGRRELPDAAHTYATSTCKRKVAANCQLAASLPQDPLSSICISSGTGCGEPQRAADGNPHCRATPRRRRQTATKAGTNHRKVGITIVRATVKVRQAQWAKQETANSGAG